MTGCGLRVRGVGVVLAVVLGVGAMAGCSSGSSSSTATTVGSSFVDQANAICRDMKAKGQALGQTQATGGDAGVADLFQQQVQVLRDGVAQLRTLQPPAPVAAAVTAYEAKLDALGDATVALVAAGSSTDAQAQAAAYTRQQQLQQEASDAATALDLTDCVF